MSGQKPMTQRMQEMLERLQNHDVYVHYLDKKVLKRLIKKGVVKIKNGDYGSVRKTIAVATVTTPVPIKEETISPGPYAKRRADMEESGLPYKGKNWGKVRVDLPREAREKKLKERELMWKKLKSWRT